MTDTKVYIVSTADVRYLMSVLEWGPDVVKASLKGWALRPTSFTHIEVHEQGQSTLHKLSRKLSIGEDDSLVTIFPASPHQKMLHLLQVAAQ